MIPRDRLRNLAPWERQVIRNVLNPWRDGHDSELAEDMRQLWRAVAKRPAGRPPKPKQQVTP